MWGLKGWNIFSLYPTPIGLDNQQNLLTEMILFSTHAQGRKIPCEYDQPTPQSQITDQANETQTEHRHSHSMGESFQD